MLKIKSKTEKSLLMLAGVLLLVLAVSVFIKDPIGSKVVADETSDSSENSEESQNSEDTENSEESQDSEESESSEESEEGELSEVSEESVASQNSGLTGEQSEISEESIESENSVDELSEESVVSEKSEQSEEFEVVSMEGDKGIVKKNERLFFIFPVEIESEATFNEQGEIVDEKKSFFNWVLSVFSF